MRKQMSYAAIVEQRNQQPKMLAEAGHSLIGYIYPHAPLEIILAHKLTPVLLWAEPQISGAYEASLQTFCCAYCRNLFSQRMNWRLPPLKGIIFPGGTCDSLQNMGDIWRARFSEDNIFRLTYPVSINDEASVNYLTKELHLLSQALESAFGQPFSQDDFNKAVTLTTQFRNAAQFIATARILQPDVITHADFSTIVRNFLTAPTKETLKQLEHEASVVQKKQEKKYRGSTTEDLRHALVKRELTEVKVQPEKTSRRIAVVGGMVDPEAISLLLTGADSTQDSQRTEIVLDLLSFGFRTIFTTSPMLEGDPFEASARTLLSAPSEPTQKGLPNRIRFLEAIINVLSIDGLIICEQSFCDPDEFETPALLTAASKTGVPSLRLYLDPEISDQSRLEGKIQSFLETLGTT
jgi:benzoyl-CoA reductase/2-hydroxyglutaryl-CoA dehydratase subunit BcrC/BadD/HgdB